MQEQQAIHVGMLVCVLVLITYTIPTLARLSAEHDIHTKTIAANFSPVGRHAPTVDPTPASIRVFGCRGKLLTTEDVEVCYDIHRHVPIYIKYNVTALTPDCQTRRSECDVRASITEIDCLLNLHHPNRTIVRYDGQPIYEGENVRCRRIYAGTNIHSRRGGVVSNPVVIRESRATHNYSNVHGLKLRASDIHDGLTAISLVPHIDMCNPPVIDDISTVILFDSKLDEIDRYIRTNYCNKEVLVTVHEDHPWGSVLLRRRIPVGRPSKVCKYVIEERNVRWSGCVIDGE